MDSLNGDVDRLECSLWEARSEVDGLRSELQATQDRLAQIEIQLSEIQLPERK